ncbi:MAG: tetratricopeptide repeat protein [Tannerella sp.]|jgi:tetratricopeptide (TPR) repeat protein|nr:tetratricopeptide repeat protein [Tannerella sp.]
MANQKSGKNTEATTAEKEVGQLVSRSEQFIENNKKNITYGIIGVAIVIAAILAYNNLYKAPRSHNAQAALFRGEYYFQKDSFNLALNGNGVDYDGFEQIIDQYGGTKAANLAKAYAGICYYKTGDIESALKYLKSFKSDEDNVAPAITGLIGDCYIESGNVKEGIAYFEKAAAKANNDFLSPIYLKKAGIAYESLQQYADALKAYTAIKEKHAASMEAMDIDKYIVRAQLAAGN